MTLSRDLPEHPASEQSRSVEVLTSDRTGATIGYCLGGGRPGPNLLVAGHGALIKEVFEKLINVPTLPWMWGKLYLIFLDDLDDEHHGDPLLSLKSVAFDETMVLPAFDTAMDVAVTVDSSYQSVLRVCAGMGMIAGRGVSRDRSPE